MPAAAGAGSQEQKQEETTNYEIGKTVRTIVREQPQIHRISLAVLVDGTESKAADGTLTMAARARPRNWSTSPAWCAAPSASTTSAATSVEVVNMRFAAAPEEAVPAEPRGPVRRRRSNGPT